MRKKYLLKVFSLICVVLFVVSTVLTACNQESQKNIVIIYTSDVHGAVDKNIGYSGVAAYKDKCEKEGSYVSLVDIGDSIQGGELTTMSKGKNIIDIMNEVGYDMEVIGNHEFDYKVENIKDLMNEAKFPYVSCNIKYTGNNENYLSDLKPYVIKEFGNTKVGFVGVTAPETLYTQAPGIFEEDNKTVYSMYGENKDEFYSCIQKNIDECRNNGANYVVLLLHLGDTDNFGDFSSRKLVENTTGADVALDGHAHNVVTDTINNKDGKPIKLSAVGVSFKNIGKLTITTDGQIDTELISDVQDKDSKIEDKINELRASEDNILSEVVGHSDVTLTRNDTNTGTKVIEHRETNIGDFCSDAYRKIANADIGIELSASIQSDLKAGDITLKDILSMLPYNNSLTKFEATGQEILDALEISYKTVEPPTNSEKYNNNSGFYNVSGLKLTIDTSVPSPVVKDDSSNYYKVSETGERRVKDVQVLNSDNMYEPIDINKTYTVATNNFLSYGAAYGISLFKNKDFIKDESFSKYDSSYMWNRDYITNYLNGNIGKEYAEPQGRITVK